MRSITEVLRDKERRMEVLRDEIEKLQLAARIMEQAEPQAAPAATEPPRPVVVNKNWP